jgi:hypothetical protein
MSKSRESQQKLDNVNLSLGEKAAMAAARWSSGGIDALADMDVDKFEKEYLDPQKAITKEQERLMKREQVKGGVRFDEGQKEAALKDFDKRYNLGTEQAKMDELEPKILKQTAELEKLQKLSDEKEGKDPRLVKAIEDLKEELGKNRREYAKAAKNADYLVKIVSKNLEAKANFEGKRLRKAGAELEAEQYVSEGILTQEDAKELAEIRDMGMSNKEVAAQYRRRMAQMVERERQAKMRVSNEFIGERRAIGRRGMGIGVRKMAAQGLITGDQASRMGALASSNDPLDQYRLSQQTQMIQGHYQNMMGEIDLDSYNIRKQADIGMADVRLGAAGRRGIDTSDIASSMSSEIDLIRGKANEILDIRRKAYEQEVEFTRNYTRMRMNVIKTHYDNATQLEAARVSGADRTQAGALQYGQEIYSIGQRALGVVQQGYAYEDRAIGEARQARAFREGKLGAYGIQTPEIIQKMRGIRNYKESAADFAKQQQRAADMDEDKFKLASSTLGSMANLGFDREALVQSEGGVQMLLQAEGDMAGLAHRAGLGEQSQERQFALLAKQKKFAARRFMAGEKIKGFQTKAMDEQLTLAEKAVAESAQKGAGEGLGDARLRADLAAKYGEAAKLAGDQGRVEDMEAFMQKQEELLDKLPEDYKKDFADVNAQMNKHLEVAEKELTSIRKHWDDFTGKVQKEADQVGESVSPKVNAKPGEFASDDPTSVKPGEEKPGWVAELLKGTELFAEAAANGQIIEIVDENGKSLGTTGGSDMGSYN